MKQEPCSIIFFFTQTRRKNLFLLLFLWFMRNTRKRKRSPVGDFLKRSEADKLLLFVFYFVLFLTINNSTSIHAFSCRVTRESGACPHIILFKRKGRTKTKNTEQIPLSFALCFWPCHPNLPLCGQLPLSWWPGKSGAGWNC